MGVFPYLHRFRAILDWDTGGWNMDEARGREKVENEDGCCGKTTFMEGFQSLIINRAPKQCAYACFFFFLKSMLHTVVFWGWLRRGYKFQLYLIVFPLLWYIWMALFLFQHDFKKNPWHFIWSFLPPSLLFGWFYFASLTLVLSSAALLGSFVTFPPHSFVEHCFDFPGSAFLWTAYQPAQSNSWPAIIHSYFIYTHPHPHRGNKLMEGALLFHYLWRKVYCFVL